jgi:nucleoside-diphosphate-sugar epimerase
MNDDACSDAYHDSRSCSRTERVVVTGGAAFIGSRPAEELVRRGYRITVVDNLSTGKLENPQSWIESVKLDFGYAPRHDIRLGLAETLRRAMA